MILLGGLRTDPCLTAVERELSDAGTPVAWFNQERWALARIACSVTAAGIAGSLRFEDSTYDIADATGIYLRLVDFRRLASLRTSSPGSEAWRTCQDIHEALRAVAEASSARLITPLHAEGTNYSKPFQTLILSREGLRVPDTLITNLTAEAHAFIEEHGTVIYKSTSAIRSIVKMLSPASTANLHKIQTCPVQFQALIPGRDIRIHVVESQLFATAIDSPTIDYRYAAREGAFPTFTTISLEDDLASAVRNACRRLGLAIAGVDLKLDNDGIAWCLEVNPNPGFSWFEEATKQPISTAIAGYLTGS